jgi:MGT family glycosyltransferase
MAKVLVLNFATPGHVDPVMPIVSELCSYGAEMVCALPESRRASVEAAGATLAPVPAPDGPEAGPHDDHALALLPYELAQNAALIVPQLLDVIETHRPDCIFYNSLYLPGALAAGFSKIRAAAWRPFHAPLAPRVVGPPYPTDELAARGAAAQGALDELCRWTREPPLSLQAAVATVEPLTLVLLPRELQHDAAAFDDRYLFVGPCLPAARPPKNLFSGQTPSLTRNLYISLGRRHRDDPEFSSMCLDAFQSGDWNTVLALGAHGNLTALHAHTEQFQITKDILQLSALAEADIFITHGGLNSTMEALFYGVPLVVIPGTREQHLTGRRVRDLGLGVMLEREDLTAEALRLATRHVVQDPVIRDQVRHMRQVIRETGGTQRAAEALLDYLAG